MKLRNTGILLILALAAVPVLLELPGCDSAKLVRPRIDNMYTIEGALIKEPNRNASIAVVRLEQDSVTAEAAEVIVANDTLAIDAVSFPESAYVAELGPADSLLAGNARVVVRDGSTFLDSLFSRVPGNFSITAVSPQLVGPGDNVTVQWTGSPNSEGYVVAAVKQDSIFQGVGWSQFVDFNATQATINDSAFIRTTFQGAEPNPGIYYIYVYAFTGSPDSALSARSLPVPFPAQLEDNIETRELNGHIGSVVVSRFGTVEVLAAP